MEFRIADTFTESLARLTGEEQKAVKITAFDLQMNPAHPSMQLHKLDKARDPNFLLCCRCCQALVPIFFFPALSGRWVTSPRLSGGFLWRWDLASPTTFYPCGCNHPSPDSLCVFRRHLEGL